MCGISGILKLDSSAADDGRLRRMIATLRHRGPDGDGIHLSGPVGLAHARLSIIDLSGGAQPMSSADGSLWITFNGEIFNYIELQEELQSKGYRFLTRSDTEVILNAYLEWGEECVHHFNGQWAFGVWDSRNRKLFLSRDRVGVRPLFYTQNSECFYFASEIKALFACPEISRDIDPHGMDQIFTFWSSIPPRTAFKGISQLPPGHSLTVANGQIQVRRYWTAPYAHDVGHCNGNVGPLAEELLHLLQDATQIRLRSDVPVGAYLSGGIDSTVTTALIGKIAGERLRSFSITFDDADFDESKFQHEASEYLGTQHSTVTCSHADIARAFPEVVRHTEQPIVRTAPVPMFLLSNLVRQSGFKVVLTGEGADEALGGYDIFKEAKIRRFWARNLDSTWRPLLLKRLYPWLQDFQKQSPAMLRKFFHVTSEDLASPFFSHLPRWELTSKLKLLFSSHFLSGYLLSSQGDRMAMAHSVEGRYPFLDYRVLSFAAKLPAAVKMKALNEKYILKRASKDVVPASILKRRKQPYRAPDSRCFFEPGAPDYVEEVLSESAVQKYGIFDPLAIKTMVGKFKAGKATSVRDDMALVGVLSTQLLASQFLN